MEFLQPNYARNMVPGQHKKPRCYMHHGFYLNLYMFFGKTLNKLQAKACEKNKFYLYILLHKVLGMPSEYISLTSPMISGFK